MDRLLKLLLANVNPAEAMANVQTIWATDRWFNFPKFQETAKNVAEIMRKAGLDDVQIGYAPADGVTQAGFWTEPMAWDPKVGTLEIISPDAPADIARSRRLSEGAYFAVHVERADSARRSGHRDRAAAPGY